MRRCALTFAVCSLACALSDEAESVSEDADGPELEASLLSLDVAKVAEASAELLNGRFGGSSSALFNHYNRWKDASKKTGEQALGNQEVRQLLKDIGLANFALRGQLATALIALSDSDGDGKVSELELGALVGLARCWLGASDEVQASARRVASLGLQVVDDWPTAPLLLDELRSCAGLKPFVSSWRKRLQDVESALMPVALRPAECIDSLAAQLGNGGHTALRSYAARLGIEPLLSRALLVSGLLRYADADADGTLGSSERRELIAPLCETASLLRERELSAVSVGAALILGSSFELSDFLAALESPAANSAHPEACAAKGVRNRSLSPTEVGALARAYLLMMPVSGVGLRDEL